MTLNSFGLWWPHLSGDSTFQWAMNPCYISFHFSISLLYLRNICVAVVLLVLFPQCYVCLQVMGFSLYNLLASRFIIPKAPITGVVCF